MTAPKPAVAAAVDEDGVTIAGHRAVVGSEAAKHLRNAAGNAEMAAWARRNAPAAYDRYVLTVASDVECAINAPGYLGPAPTPPGAP